MLKNKIVNILVMLFLLASPLFYGSSQALATATQASSGPATQTWSPYPNDEIGGTNTGTGQMRTTTAAMRQAAASQQSQTARKTNLNIAGIDKNNSLSSPLNADSTGALAAMNPLGIPDYFGVANWALSPLPQVDPLTGAVVPLTGIRKFTTAVSGLCGIPTANSPAGLPNALGQCMPVAVPDTTTFPGSDYYEIGLVQYKNQFSPDLPATLVRGYVQISPVATAFALSNTLLNGTVVPILQNGQPVYGVTAPSYMGPVIVASGCDPLAANKATCTARPVRVKFTNFLPTQTDGNLFIPMDNTYMGAGMGPGGSVYSFQVTNGGAGYVTTPTVTLSASQTVGGTQATAVAAINNGQVVSVLVTNGGTGYTAAPSVTFTGGGATTVATATAVLAGNIPGEMYTQNRATLHLHGGNTPWISDGTPHQWTAPVGEVTSYKKGDSVGYVPDMCFNTTTGAVVPGLQTACPGGSDNNPGPGSLTFYWTNQQSGRLMFYHDHAYGITRLNVYVGEAAGYLITDPVQEAALALATVPGTVISDPVAGGIVLASSDLAHMVPLVIQDRSFVPDDGTGSQLAVEDPTWDVANWGGKGALWFPHVYTPNQNPADVTGANAYGRWDYGPWFWPPQDPSTFVLGGRPFSGATCTSIFYNGTTGPAFPPLVCPGIPNPSGVPEGFMDTPTVNGTAYPTLTVDPAAYRFQILNADNDRTLNLGLYLADPLAIAITIPGTGYAVAPTVNITPAAGDTTGGGAMATAVVSGGSISSLTFTNVGAGYTSNPGVVIGPPNVASGVQATATGTYDPITKTVLRITLTNAGSGYTAAPTVTIDPPLNCTGTCTTATAVANVLAAGAVQSIIVTNPGAGYTLPPVISFTPAAGDLGTGAAAIASVNSEVKMVPAVPPVPTSTLQPCTQVNPTGGAMLVSALLDPVTGNPLNGTGLEASCWPSAWPVDGRDGGVPDPTTAGPPIIQIGAEGGLLPSPVVIPSTPVGYEYNRRSITVLNVFTHGL